MTSAVSVSKLPCSSDLQAHYVHAIIVGESTVGKIAAAKAVKKLSSGARLVIVPNSAQVYTEFSSVPADLVFFPETVAARILVNLLVNDSVPKDLRNIITMNR